MRAAWRAGAGETARRAPAVRHAAYLGRVPMLQYSDEERERFATFASLLLICRDVLRQVMEQTQMQPSDGSGGKAQPLDSYGPPSRAECSGLRQAHPDQPP